MPRRDQRAWIMCLFFNIPLISLVMLHFAYWHSYQQEKDSEEEPTNFANLENEPEKFIQIH